MVENDTQEGTHCVYGAVFFFPPALSSLLECHFPISSRQCAWSLTAIATIAVYKGETHMSPALRLPQHL